MKVFVNPEYRVSQRGSVVTIGSFDGVHYGHRVILKELIKTATKNDLDSSLITLFPHPRKVLGLDLEGFGVLNSLSEKEELLKELGLDILVEIEFTELFSELTAREFTKKYLVDKLNAKIVIIGYDHQFGNKREGGYELLQELGTEFGFKVRKIAKQDVDNQKVSSTVVRNALKNGEIDAVAKGLGYRYFIDGEFDENNIFTAYDDMKLFPKEGVYEAKILSDGQNMSVNVIIDGKKAYLQDKKMSFKYKKAKIIL